MLRSGASVLSINGHSCPAWWGREHVTRFDAAGRDGRATLMAAGLNPGFAFEKLAVGATGLCTSVSNVMVREQVDTTLVRSPEYVFEVLGFGVLGFGVRAGRHRSERARLRPGRAPRPEFIEVLVAVATRPEFIEVLGAVATRPEFIEVLGAVATRPDVTLERVETDHVMYAATRTLEIGAGTIEAGTVARTHGQWHGVVDGERFRTMSIERTMEPVVTGVSGAPLRQIEITGDPYVSLAVELRRRPDDPRRTTAERYGVAGAVLNAHVLAAAPGVCLPPMAAPWRRSLVG